MYESLVSRDSEPLIHHLIHRRSSQFNYIMGLLMIVPILKLMLIIYMAGFHKPFPSISEFVVICLGKTLIMVSLNGLSALYGINKTQRTPIQQKYKSFYYALMKYCMNDTTKIQRIIATNYYLKSVFHPEISTI